VYYPLQDHHALFREFAATPPTPEGVLAFAGQYGDLGIRCGASVEDPDEPGRLTGISGEPFGWWVWNIALMGQALTLFDAIRNRDRPALSRLVRWEAGPEGSIVLHTAPPVVPRGVRRPPGEVLEATVIASPQLHGWWLDHFIPGDTFRPAGVYLNRLVNARLHGKVSPMLLQNLSSAETHLRLVPHTLLGCLWLELAETVATGKEQRQCSACGRWFESRPRGDRDDPRRFCSVACRVRAYRVRQGNALKRHREGKVAEQIAEELGARPEAVQGWIARQLRTEGKGDREIARELGVGVAKVKRWLAGKREE
jgi:hypothetical protein